jgi:hypothetical protein
MPGLPRTGEKAPTTVGGRYGRTHFGFAIIDHFEALL